ncbi:hypothetical protein B0H66DRAFT_531095 [Apodospora peruviana]|uniref:Uncharacterized protein n=1 Tax=Apodospora peruviana TaxID=516989 RepID=A0AAE0IAU3_9PEZI|nr:hypothetical protein B0H66DRAFT_531095 [Apodospora peruviana]
MAANTPIAPPVLGNTPVRNAFYTAAARLLDYNPLTSLGAADTIALVNGLWNQNILHHQQVVAYSSVVVAMEHERAVFDPGVHIISRYGDLYHLVTIINQHRMQSRRQLVQIVRAQLPVPAVIPDQRVLNSIDFAVRCCLMIRFNRPGGVQPGGEHLYPWLRRSLRSTINGTIPRRIRDSGTYELRINQFPGMPGGPLTGTVKRPEDELDLDREFPDLFTLADMDKLTGFTIQYTSNLLEHLRVVRFRRRKFRVTVYIFPHAAVLTLLQNGALRDHQQLVQETLDTLALLIPANKHCRRWYNWSVYQSRRPDGKLALDRTAGQRADVSRRVGHYSYWRPRLLELEKTFDSASPRTLVGWYHDRRNKREFATFWTACAAVVLAIIALVLAAASTAYGVISGQQAVLANAYASNASTSALAAAAESQNSSTGNNNNSTYTPITAFNCCSPVDYCSDKTTVMMGNGTSVMTSLPVKTTTHTVLEIVTTLKT